MKKKRNLEKKNKITIFLKKFFSREFQIPINFDEKLLARINITSHIGEKRVALTVGCNFLSIEFLIVDSLLNSSNESANK